MTEHGSSGSPQWAPPGGQVPGPVSGPAAPPPPPYPASGAPASPNFYAVGPPRPVAVAGPPPPPPSNARSGPVRVEPVPGTEFGLAIATVPPTFCGQAIGSLVAGIGSIVVSFIVGCFGFAGGPDGWGVIVAGAFAILAGLLGLGGIGLGLVAVRLIKASRGQLTGRGVAISGIACGGSGVVLTAGGLLLALAAQVTV